MQKHDIESHIARQVRRCAAAVVVVLLATCTASAQVLNPTAIEFRPPLNQADISRYDVAFYDGSSLNALLVLNLGKPAPQADGLIRVDLTGKIGVWPRPNVPCDARVVAVTTSGSSLSLASNTFVYQCTFTLSATSQSFGSSGGTGSVGLTANSWCGWQATSSASWLTTTTASGAGSRTINYSVASNTGTSSRTATLTIAGQTYTVTQGAATAPAPSPPPSSTNTPPAIRITRPANGEKINGRFVRIEVDATDRDGAVTGVTFYANGTQIGASTSATATLRVELSPGTHTLTAVATDNNGAKTTSSAVAITVR